MAAELPDLNQRLATVVAGYLCISEGGERLWRRPDGTSIAHCPNFESGERWEDLERGLQRADVLTAVQDRLGQELRDLHSTARWRDALLTMLDLLMGDSRVVQADHAALSALGLQPDRAADATSRRAVLRSLRRARTTLSLTQQLVFFDRPTFCRDAAGQFRLVYQSYASTGDLAPLLAVLAAHGLEGRVLEVPPFAPAVRLLMVSAASVPVPSE
ncbi:hypothetical protein [Deinococcus budaensis]|uniref:Uncharacterized protein n=1 Tax=Deinococcus budaensis TaxID=1665626 RepID=A0A7W8LPY1_9DEIO|nr:hypothetical protein [Deinococcus budaensis]MBB5234184.1 hypothetical protein [Deinococcus budaensis]